MTIEKIEQCSDRASFQNYGMTSNPDKCNLLMSANHTGNEAVIRKIKITAIVLLIITTNY